MDASSKGGRFQMIRSIEVSNFRCYDHLEISDISPINVIVGDNGSGKTALLEAMFLALVSGTQVAVRFRQNRGIDGVVGGELHRIEAAIWGDLFHNGDMSKPVKITLSGDAPEQRSITISRGIGDAVVPLNDGGAQVMSIGQPIVFSWTDSGGVTRSVSPSVNAAGLQLPETGEILPDFFMFPAGQVIGSAENATRFSDLSKENKHQRFIDTLRKEYGWIEDLNVEIHGGAPVLFATLVNHRRKVPLPNVSGGINHIVAILLAIASRQHSIILIDEIESGIFHTHLPAVWRSILTFSREFDTQIFATTHSKECLEALVDAAGEETSDLSLWRVSREGDKVPEVAQFSGDDLRLGIEYEEDLR